MTTTAAEGSLASYLDYTGDGGMQGAASEMVASLETTIASMQTQEYGEPVTGPLQQAMELAEQMKALLAESHAKLNESVSVQDAYSAAEHTGNRESLLAG